MKDVLIDKLKALKPLTQDYKELICASKVTKEEYISVKLTKPERKIINEPKTNMDEFKSSLRKAAIFFSISAIVTVLSIFLTVSLENLAFSVGAFSAGILCFVYISSLVNLSKGYKEEKEKYIKQLKEIDSAQRFNEQEYPLLLKKYEEDYAEKEKEFDDFHNEVVEGLSKLEKSISDLEIDYPVDAYELIDLVIRSLVRGESQTLKEAITCAEYDAIEIAEREEAEERMERERMEAEMRREMEAERALRLIKEEAEKTRMQMARDSELARNQASKAAREAKWEADKAAREAKSAASMRCSSCAATNCRIKHTSASINCAAYRPR